MILVVERSFDILIAEFLLYCIDMDDTILYLMKAIHADHLKKHPDHPLNFEDMIAFNDDMLHPDYNKIDFFMEPGTFYNLEIMEDAAEELQRIHEAYDLIIVTAAFPESVPDKWRWVQKYLPFVPAENFITCSRKDLIQADILIDDAKHNVEKWVETGRPALVPSHHWNQDLEKLQGVKMVYGWHGMKAIIDFVLYDHEREQVS